MAPELRVVLGLSGIFILFFVLVAGPIGSAATAAAKTFF
jgi:NADH-quinone oxidoreductase subunit N